MSRFENFDAEAEAHLFDSDAQVSDLTDEQRIVKAVAVAIGCGQYDGIHHKQWTLDQIVRILTGDEYDSVVAGYEAGEDGPHSHEWDTGKAP